MVHMLFHVEQFTNKAVIYIDILCLKAFHPEIIMQLIPNIWTMKTNGPLTEITSQSWCFHSLGITRWCTKTYHWDHTYKKLNKFDKPWKQIDL